MASDIPQIEPSHRGKALPIAGLSLSRLLAVGILLGLGLWLHSLVGLVLLFAGTDLAMSRQPFALACGWLVELVCDPALAAWQSERSE